MWEERRDATPLVFFCQSEVCWNVIGAASDFERPCLRTLHHRLTGEVDRHDVLDVLHVFAGLYSHIQKDEESTYNTRLAALTSGTCFSTSTAGIFEVLGVAPNTAPCTSIVCIGGWDRVDSSHAKFAVRTTCTSCHLRIRYGLRNASAIDEGT